MEKGDAEKVEDNIPEFRSSPWNKKEIKWKDKFFVKGTFISVFHVPLTLGSVLKKNQKKIKLAKAEVKEPIIILDHLSLFHSHVYIEVTKPVVGCKDVKLTGNFLSNVFEGPHKNIGKWIKEMNEYVKSKGKVTKKNYFFYPTSREYFKKHGKNYTVILAEI